MELKELMAQFAEETGIAKLTPDADGVEFCGDCPHLDTFEYNKTYSMSGFQALCQNMSFSVLEWPPEAVNPQNLH